MILVNSINIRDFQPERDRQMNERMDGGTGVSTGRWVSGWIDGRVAHSLLCISAGAHEKNKHVAFAQAPDGLRHTRVISNS